MAVTYSIAIQARMGSTRLPLKMATDFYRERSIPQLLVEELLAHFPAQQIVLATTSADADADLAKQAAELGIRAYRGSEADVLQRVSEAVAGDNSDYIVRVCADNPFLRGELIRQLLDSVGDDTVDYASFQLPDGTPSIMSHLGLFAELIRAETLNRIQQTATLLRHREHLTTHILDQPEQYSLRYLPIPQCLQSRPIRLTVDTAADFTTCQQLYATVIERFGPRFSVQQLVEVIGDQPALLATMASEIAANQKS